MSCVSETTPGWLWVPDGRSDPQIVAIMTAHATPRSWWCQPCSVEVYSLRCKYCGKSEEEER